MSRKGDKLAPGRQDRDNFITNQITAAGAPAPEPAPAPEAPTDLVTVRTIRQHDTVQGMKWPGDEYQRERAEADALAGTVEIIA